MFDELRRNIIVSLDDIGNDKYFHCEFYDRCNQLSEKAFLNKAFLVRALFIARDVFNVLSREKFRFVCVLRMSKLITKLILLLLTFCCVFLHTFNIRASRD